jgi:hypothetical protein
VLDGKAGTLTQQFHLRVAAGFHLPSEVRSGLRELQRYRTFALLALALACLIALVIIRVRRRRRGLRSDPAEARPVSGRHAVGGPAGIGDLPAGRLDFSHFTVMRQDIQDPDTGWSSHGTRRLAGPVADEPSADGRGVQDRPPGQPGPSTPFGDPVADEPSANGVSPGGPDRQRAPEGEPDADSSAAIPDALPSIPPPEESEPGDNGTGEPSAGPPWEPAERPSAGPPWEPAEEPPGQPPWAPTNTARAGQHGLIPQQRPPGPGKITDVPPS